MSIINKLKAVADIITPPTGYKTLFFRSDTGVPAVKDENGTVSDLVIAGDASGVTYTPADSLDWSDSTDPGNVDDALDDLAARTRELENSSGEPVNASQVLYTPQTSLHWTDSEDPGEVDDALDDLAARVNALEENPGGGGGSGDVVGPASSTANAIAKWADTTGELLADSGVTIDGSNNVSGVAALAATTIELGHASDTTLARASAGNVSVEGNLIYRAGGTDVPVADGGTGVSSLTAYAPVFGGTTSTGAVQSGTVGTAYQVLTSNGAGALPTFKNRLDYAAVFSEFHELITFANAEFATLASAGGSVSFTAATAGHPGVVELTTAASAATSVGIMRSAAPVNASASIVAGGGELIFESVFQIDSLWPASNTGQIRLGFMDEISGAPTNGIHMQYDSGSANWQLYNRSTAGGSSNIVGGTVVTTGWHFCRIVVNAAATSVELFIDGVSQGTLATTIPTLGFTYGAEVQKATGTTAMILRVDTLYVSQVFTSARF